MARKKSAAKKAREAAARAEQAPAPVPEPTKDKDTPVSESPERISEDDQSSSESEDEDEYGELLTEGVEESIQKVLKTLKSDPKKLLDPNAKFFDEKDLDVAKKAKDKPMYLKDYHREALLSGDYKNYEDNEYGTVDGEKPFVVTEREERNQLLDDIKSAFNAEEDGEEEDDFLKKKEQKPISRGELMTQLPDPTKSADEFLSEFLDKKAWVPKENDKVIDLDQIDNDVEQDFDDAVDDFERAYNFRYEDPNSAEIVSYARTQATVRRDKTNARKKERERKRAEKEKEKAELEKAVQKKKTEKLNKVVDRLSKIKEAVGEDIPNEVIEKVFGDSLLNDDFDDADWDDKMAQVFDAQYYGAEIAKPEWDEDDEIMREFHAEKGAEEEEDIGEVVEEDEEKAAKKSSKKDKLKEKKEAKKKKHSIVEEAEKIVKANTLKIQDEVEEERGRSLEADKFRYREVSPESFGLSTREILLADDSALNQFVSIKKFAPYRPKEQALKDKRKFAKKKHLQQWRKEVFKDKEGPARQPGEKEDEIWIANDEEAEERPRKKSKKNRR